MSGTDPENQARVTLAASANPLPAESSQTGPIAPDQILTVSVITRRKKPLVLSDLGGQVLTHLEFEREYAADADDFEALRVFAHEHGLSVDEAASSLARRTLVLKGPASRMETAFGVKLHTYQHLKHNKHFHCFEGSLSLPADQADRIEAVLGLDTRPIAKSHMRRLETGVDGNIIRANATSASFSPVQVAALYGFPKNLTGAGQCIGILELGGGYEASDITSFFDSLGLTPPSVVAVSVDGGTNVPGGDPNGADGEVALDIQVAGAVAPGAKLAVYFSPNTDQGFIDCITTAVHDSANKPSVLSISWGGPESSWSAASRTALDNACQSAAALGVTITVASGDNGSSDGGSGNNVDFPASSPHVLACGGTRLAGSGATISSEIVWNDQPSGGATGGGVSTVFALPTWQANANVPKSSTSVGGRGVPDVAGDASPESGYSVLVDGQQQVVGGTSAVAPLWAGLLALVNQQRSASGLGPAGFVNPQLYADTAALRDITSGSNGSFKAATGWDACTGLGSPIGTSVLQSLSGTTAGVGGTTPTPNPTPTPAPTPVPTPAPTPAPPPKHKKKHHHES
ncbi:protease pro-enzyme activation domain-containing protein [Acidipila sp. EB88]|uniref:S53 family peptidase n=1 Tax=Acidipila sp. EB88 TaxID=2305226 RepID=UPI000F5F77BB|nr:S53 family peptidase [Acidipila sp. EB88]RRA50075.1 peptidase S53 [Acidipila sp. EB88]